MSSITRKVGKHVAQQCGAQSILIHSQRPSVDVCMHTTMLVQRTTHFRPMAFLSNRVSHWRFLSKHCVSHSKWKANKSSNVEQRPLRRVLICGSVLDRPRPRRSPSLPLHLTANIREATGTLGRYFLGALAASQRSHTARVPYPTQGPPLQLEILQVHGRQLAPHPGPELLHRVQVRRLGRNLPENDAGARVGISACP